MAQGYNIHANGIRQHLLRWPGPGEEMLLIPGITSPAALWGFAASRLCKHFDVHVLDVRGRGLSEAGDLDYSLDALADDALAVIRTMGFKKPVVLGHSMGARTAIRAARKRPGDIGRLILVDPPVSGPGRRPYPASWAWYEDSILMARQGCSAEDMRKFCPSWTDEQNALRAEWLHTCHLDAVRIAYEGFQTDDIHADLAHIALPIRLIEAGAAPVITPEDVAEMKALAPQLDHRVVEGAGHMIPWDDLEGFLFAVTTD